MTPCGGALPQAVCVDLTNCLDFFTIFWLVPSQAYHVEVEVFVPYEEDVGGAALGPGETFNLSMLGNRSR